MPARNLVSKAKASRHAVDFDLVLSGMKLTVPAGSFTIEGTQYTLDDDEEFTAVSDPSDLISLEGFLVLSAGVPRLLVNAVGPNEPTFYFEGSSLTLLHRLFTLRVPAGATSLSEDDLTVHKIKESLDG